jgi:hypothetical protein
MDHIEFAVHATAHGNSTGHLPAMAKYLGLKEQVLRNKVNPEQEQANIRLDEAIRMMRKDGDLRILYAIAAEFKVQVKAPVADKPKSLMMAVLTADAEHGDVTRTVADAISDRRWTQAEKAEAMKQIREARAALDALEQAVIAE